MIKLKMQDAEGHGYWLCDDGQFVLALKELPSVGSQFRTIAWLKKGIYDLRHTHWHKQHKCWYPARFPLIKTVSFGIDIVHIDMDDADIEAKGFVHPRVLTNRNVTWHSTGYEIQLQLLPGDLCETREEAEEIWEKLKKKLNK